MTPRASANRGLFLTLEGVDGAGKSTHLEWLCEHIGKRGHRVVQTREPGGTPLGEQLREILLQHSMHLETETLLMFASRMEHIRSVIEPALARGDWVLSDRFTDATYAYQGGGRELGADRIAPLESWVQQGLQPDRTWLFDLPLEVAKARRGQARQADRFEQENDAFFQRTRFAYLERAQREPSRFKIIDAARSVKEIRAELEADLATLEHQYG